ncbi:MULTISPECIES: hypothetical protein [unclassified Rhodanobacter]|uniref:hypothetical protein n=1 Tax=unclassified Rhodanobacter TaxID=2621553 RepID=UPI001BDDFCBA|nr:MULTISPECIES: hypothetical protein [unclassified Rhodanobacter]MBT2144195.1 hypothetical protein [Rhodanobacter sp. LX-99]MBT2150138.1 hypothetical protein [Rhodanobacter sp. LX-100]
MSTLLIYSWIALAADIVLFTALYFCVVLLRVNDAGGKVGSDAFFNFGPLRYVPMYLRLLTPQESSRWYNIYIKHSMTITVVLALVFMAILALS